MIAKYDYKTGRYKRHKTKWQCRVSQKWGEPIHCAECGKETLKTFTSNLIMDTMTQTPYLICEDCMVKEIYKERGSMK